LFAIIVLSDRCWLRCYCTNATHSSMALMLQPKTASHSVVIVVIATIVISRGGRLDLKHLVIPLHFVFVVKLQLHQLPVRHRYAVVKTLRVWKPLGSGAGKQNLPRYTRYLGR